MGPAGIYPQAAPTAMGGYIMSSGNDASTKKLTLSEVNELRAERLGGRRTDAETSSVAENPLGDDAKVFKGVSFASMAERAETVDACIGLLMKHKLGGDGGSALKVIRVKPFALTNYTM
jgi:hypothetical protein